MEVDPDFDPTTEEGRTDINEDVDDEYDSLLKRPDENEVTWSQRIRSRFGRGSGYAIRRLRDKFDLKIQ